MPRDRLRSPRALAALACVIACASSRVRADAKVLNDDAFVGDDAPRYVVRVPKDPLDVSPIAPHRRVPMTAHDGKKYVCTIPLGATGDGEDDGEDDGALETALGGTREDAETPKATRLEDIERARTVDEHLRPLEGRCFYYSNGDWWTYELCYKTRVEQFHREGTTRVNSYSLGKFDEAATMELESERAAAMGDGAEAGVDSGKLALENQRYHAHAFTDGKKCEDVGAAYSETRRTSEVRFVCAEDGSEGLSGVEEPATCRYVLTFRTPLACKAKDLRPKRPDVEQITCALVEDDAADETAARNGGENPEPATNAAESAGADAQTSTASAQSREEL